MGYNLFYYTDIENMSGLARATRDLLQSRAHSLLSKIISIKNARLLGLSLILSLSLQSLVPRNGALGTVISNYIHHL